MAKKLLKKLGKAAAVAAALYGATKLGGKGKRNKLIDKGIAAAKADKGSDMLKSLMPSNLSRDTGSSTFTPPSSGDPHEFRFPNAYKAGGRIGAKSGGRVKSMGIAKRGGGAVKR